MADVRISQLPAATDTSTTDELPANQDGTTRKVTHAQIVSSVDARATSLAQAVSVISQQLSVQRSIASQEHSVSQRSMRFR